ncbi:hypothetical protein EZV73_22185 [Acidaminobacter sp. JC074]|uniref:sensor histidine kinase n=1 Tax=Acidaminobacter sp. JC074 TaxID=2530199 RepID=UPI001F10CA74|nr:ATP-binding protein [Acidaminobacter sp. JC074]MCH4890308.1 hypothetical protein [Acidaminobacter sp. JC074]
MNDLQAKNLVARFRLATMIFAVFLSFVYETEMLANTNLIIISCLIVSNSIMLYFTHNEERETAILIACLLEAIGIGIILINSDVYFGYYFWMLLNPVLLVIVKLNGRKRNTFIIFNIFLCIGITFYTYQQHKTISLSDAHVIFGFIVVLIFVIVLNKIMDNLKATQEILRIKHESLEKSYQGKAILTESLLGTTDLMDNLTYANTFKQSLEILKEHFEKWDDIDSKFIIVNKENLSDLLLAEHVDGLTKELLSLAQTGHSDNVKLIYQVIHFDNSKVYFGTYLETMVWHQEIKQHLEFIRKLFNIHASRLKLLNYHGDLLIEKEQNRIAEQIHDQVNQSLFASSCLIYNIENQIEVYNNDLLNKQMSTLRKTLKDTNAELKDIIYKMSINKGKKYLERERMVDYIEDLAMIYNVTIETSILDSFDDYGDDIKYSLFRVINEAIVNSVNHGKCNKIYVSITEADEKIYLEIRDNGKGFNQSTLKRRGLGLKNMEKISNSFNGIFEIHSQPGAGTQIKLVIS